MQAQRIITQVDSSGHLMSLPLLQPGQTVEVIMLIHEHKTLSTPLRRAPSSLYGKIRETGDVFSTASPQDWGLS
jgi:hypothetical protein